MFHGFMEFHGFFSLTKIVFNSLFNVRCNATVHFPGLCSYLELSSGKSTT